MAATLHSDHVNYLILRYLQEFGHENAARAFLQDWNRPIRYTQPEAYPFATSVQRNELVSIIQNGLYLDELQARSRKCTRRYQWTSLDAQDSTQRPNGVVEHGDASRPSSRSKQRERQPAARRSGDFPMPAPKRQRRSEGSEAHLNGDAMDIDGDAASGAELEEETATASPANASEMDVSVAAERFDSVHTQTEQRVGPKTSTAVMKLEPPNTCVYQGTWDPRPRPGQGSLLLAVGEGLCRYYSVPDGEGTASPGISQLDVSAVPALSIVTAMTWRPDGSAAVCVVESSTGEYDHGRQPQTVLEHSAYGHLFSYRLPNTTKADTTRVILHLSYSPDGRFLLAVSENGESNCSLSVWTVPDINNGSSTANALPIAVHPFDESITDATWTNDTTVMLTCYQRCSMYEVLRKSPKDCSDLDYPWHFNHVKDVAEITERQAPTKFCYHQDRQLAAFVDLVSGVVQVTTEANGDFAKSGYTVTGNLGGQIVDVAFQPRISRGHDDGMQDENFSPLLAVTYVNGDVRIFKPDFSQHKLREGALISLAHDTPALTIAWAPDGNCLAVGSLDIVQIWPLDALRERTGVRRDALVTWRPPHEANGLTNGHSNGEHHELKPVSAPSLSWSADGENLAFSLENQIAFMRFRPPLSSNRHDAGTNGALSP